MGPDDDGFLSPLAPRSEDESEGADGRGAKKRDANSAVRPTAFRRSSEETSTENAVEVEQEGAEEEDPKVLRQRLQEYEKVWRQYVTQFAEVPGLLQSMLLNADSSFERAARLPRQKTDGGDSKPRRDLQQRRE